MKYRIDLLENQASTKTWRRFIQKKKKKKKKKKEKTEKDKYFSKINSMFLIESIEILN